MSYWTKKNENSCLQSFYLRSKSSLFLKTCWLFLLLGFGFYDFITSFWTTFLSDLFSEADKLTELQDLLKMMLVEATMKSGSDPGDRLVNASSNGNLQEVREILEANPDKVT